MANEIAYRGKHNAILTSTFPVSYEMTNRGQVARRYVLLSEFISYLLFL